MVSTPLEDGGGEGDFSSIVSLRFYDYIDDFDHPWEALFVNVLGLFS